MPSTLALGGNAQVGANARVGVAENAHQLRPIAPLNKASPEIADKIGPIGVGVRPERAR